MTFGTPFVCIAGSADAKVSRTSKSYRKLYIDETPDPDELVVGEQNRVGVYSISDLVEQVTDTI